MRKHIFSCSAEEWLFSRFFTILYHVDKGAITKIAFEGKDKKKFRKSLAIFIVMFTVAVIGLVNDKTNAFFFLLLLAAIITFMLRIFYFDNREQYEKNQLFLNNPELNSDVVDFLILNEQGIYVNEVNDFSDEVLPFVKWDSIRSIHFSYCIHHLRRNEGIHSPTWIIKNITQYFQRVKELSPYFSIEPKIQYDDRFMLEFKTEGKIKTSLVALPKEWIGNGQCKELFEKIEFLSGLKVERPFESGIYSLDKLNRVYDRIRH